MHMVRRPSELIVILGLQLEIGRFSREWSVIEPTANPLLGQRLHAQGALSDTFAKVCVPISPALT